MMKSENRTERLQVRTTPTEKKEFESMVDKDFVISGITMRFRSTADYILFLHRQFKDLLKKKK